MTAIDLVMVSLALTAAWALRRCWSRLRASGRARGPLLSFTGLLLLTGVYAADLVARWALPLIAAPELAAQGTDSLHPGVTWLWLPVAAAFVFSGLLRSTGDDLELTEENERTFARMAASEERFRRLSQATFEGIAISRDGVVLDANDRCLELLGRPLDEVVGMRVTDLVVEAERDALDRSIRDRSEDTGEYRGLRSDGTTIPVRVRARHMEVDGETLRIASITDLSSEQEALAALRESEERYRTLVEMAPVPILAGTVAAEGGTLLYANPAASGLLGAADEAGLVGRPIGSLFPSGEPPAAGDAGDRPVRVLGADGAARHAAVYRVEGMYEGRAAQLLILVDATGQQRVQRELRRSQAQHQALSRKLIEMLEAERSHLARELHDETGQAFTAVKMNLQALRQAVGDERTRRRIDETLRISDDAIKGLRRLALNLRPSLLDDLGLLAALRWLTDEGARRSEIEVSFDADEIRPRPTPEIETACFRIAQEALTNVFRHSGASRAEVSLRSLAELLELRVADNGTGFDAGLLWSDSGTERRLGILGMRERAQLVGGKLEVASTPGRGTVLVARFPKTAVAAKRR